ncbi:MAG: putative CofD-related protein [Cyanobacteria bacterium RYN_339]|nr:putative CofD-related protein [Cyanobacteria bacterium RYN_339]
MNYWRELRTWALPGMRIKRWIALTLLGISSINAAVGLEAIDLLRPGTHLFGGAIAALGLGIIGVAVGLHRLLHVVAETLQPDTNLAEAMFNARTLRRGPKIVAIGGGTGLSTLLRGLKEYSDNITAIVTVADDGGSSGRLRQELGVLPPGDIRNCLTALAREERLLTELFSFRFPGATGLGGHSFGNLFLAAMTGISGDLMQAIQRSSAVLAVRGQVVPATMAQMTLFARFDNGEVVRGESGITAERRPIIDMWCDPAQPVALPEAVRAILEADAIILGPGSLYTSLVPHLLIPGLRDALLASRAPRIYVCNVMTQPGETDGFRASDHVRVLQRFGGAGVCQHVLVNEALPRRLRERYESQGQFPVELDWEALVEQGVSPVRGAFIDEAEVVRHNSSLLAAAIMTWVEAISPGRAHTARLVAPAVPE